jgi:hypothetical protein
MYVLRILNKKIIFDLGKNLLLTSKQSSNCLSLILFQSVLRYKFAQYAANNAKLEAGNALNGFRNLKTRRSHCQKLLNSKNNELLF